MAMLVFTTTLLPRESQAQASLIQNVKQQQANIDLFTEWGVPGHDGQYDGVRYSDTTSYSIGESYINGNLRVRVAEIISGTVTYSTTYGLGSQFGRSGSIALNGNVLYETSCVTSVPTELPLNLGRYDTTHNGYVDLLVVARSVQTKQVLGWSLLGGSSRDCVADTVFSGNQLHILLNTISDDLPHPGSTRGLQSEDGYYWVFDKDLTVAAQPAFYLGWSHVDECHQLAVENTTRVFTCLSNDPASISTQHITTWLYTGTLPLKMNSNGRGNSRFQYYLGGTVLYKGRLLTAFTENDIQNPNIQSYAGILEHRQSDLLDFGVSYSLTNTQGFNALAVHGDDIYLGMMGLNPTSDGTDVQSDMVVHRLRYNTAKGPLPESQQYISPEHKILWKKTLSSFASVGPLTRVGTFVRSRPAHHDYIAAIDADANGFDVFGHSVLSRVSGNLENAHWHRSVEPIVLQPVRRLYIPLLKK
jgi:hypothetical protein